MDDDLLALDRAPKARRVGHIALNCLLAGQAGALPTARLALQHANLVAVVDEPPDDVRADEAGGAGDEDPHEAKFFQ